MGESTQKMTVEAEAKNFGPTEKAAEALDKTLARLAQTQAKLAAARKSGTVEDVAKLTAEEKALSSPVEELRGKQEGLNASESDFIGVLSRINPVLGGFVDAMLQGGKIAGDFANQQVSVNRVVMQGVGAIKKNTAALQLLGAAGLGAAGISGIASAFAGVAREAAEATREMERQIAVLNELEGKRRDTPPGPAPCAHATRRAADAV